MTSYHVVVKGRLGSMKRVLDSMNTDAAGVSAILAYLDQKGWQDTTVQIGKPSAQAETLTGPRVIESLEVNV